MSKFISFIPLLLLLSLVIIETATGSRVPAALSQRSFSQQETDMLFSLLKQPLSNPDELATSAPFLDWDLDLNPGQVIPDTTTLYPSPSPTTLLTQPTLLPTGQDLSDVLPPFGSALYYAYQDDGLAWYQKAGNILVIFPDETIRSFNQKTGEETSWLQDKLAALPITEIGAYEKYQTQYKARVVASTSTFALMEFPSGGVLKVAKPTPIPNAGGTYNLPNILPGYE